MLADGALNALLELGERGEEFGLFGPDLAFGESLVDFGVAGLEVDGAVMDAAGEDGVLDGAGALETPAVFRDGMRQFLFLEADGGERFAVAGAVGFESGDLCSSRCGPCCTSYV